MTRKIILNYLKALRKSLLKTQARLSSKHRIKGSLKIKINQGYVSYYHRADEKDTGGTFIRKQDVSFAKQLAQQDYERKVSVAIGKTLVVIDRCVKVLDRSLFPDEIYEALPDLRKELVEPYDSDEEYVKVWLQKHTYQEAYFNSDMPVLETENGERVRSKTEHMMANRFKARGIIYVYEPIVETNVRIRRPDFLVLNKRTRKEYYIEHLGLMNNLEYVKENMEKLREYEEVGLILGKNLLLVFSDLDHPFDSRMLDVFIDNFLL